MKNLELTKIEEKIYIIRGQKVILDIDLAELYGVDTRIINRNIKRNIERFPKDFMFQLDPSEYESLRSQIGISKKSRGGRRYRPFAFTELGIAMLSSVLNSKRAIEVNISIMRLFIKLRSFMLLEKGLSERMNRLEQGTNKMFRVVFERLDDLEDVSNSPPLLPGREKIGIKR